MAAGDVGAAWGRGGRGQTAACAPDEDTLTLAWEAGTRRARRRRASTAADVDAVFWGTSRPPFAEGPSFAVPRRRARMRADGRRRAAAGSAHAGMEALLAAADAVAAGSARVALVIASDALRPGLGTAFEARCGAGAAAFVLAPKAAPPRSAHG